MDSPYLDHSKLYDKHMICMSQYKRQLKQCEVCVSTILQWSCNVIEQLYNFFIILYTHSQPHYHHHHPFYDMHVTVARQSYDMLTTSNICQICRAIGIVFWTCSKYTTMDLQGFCFMILKKRTTMIVTTVAQFFWIFIFFVVYMACNRVRTNVKVALGIDRSNFISARWLM